MFYIRRFSIIITLITLFLCTILHIDCILPTSETQTSPILTESNIQLTIPNRLFKKAPIIVYVTDQHGINRNFSGKLSIKILDSSPESNNIFDIIKGIGSALIPISNGEIIELKDINGNTILRKELVFSQYDTLFLSGNVPDSLLEIDSCTVIIFNNDVTIPAGKTFKIQKDVIFLGSKNSNIFIDGNIECLGDQEHPICFAPLNGNEPWGGIILKGEGVFTYTILTGGGGNTEGDFVIGHSNSQGLIHVNGGQLEVTNTFFIYNAGKGITSRNGVINIDSSLFTFCDMGSEFEMSEVSIQNSYFLFTPDSTSDIVDDDNDALYFLDDTSVVNDKYSYINNSILFYGKDDAIDHNGANLVITNCWIEDFVHEGLAGSNGNSVSLTNCYIAECEQGVEAGWGAPYITVNHCLIRENKVGVRFGDSYDWGCYGQMFVENSIVYYNTTDIMNLDLKTMAPKDSGIIINFSIIDSNNYEPGQNNITQEPQFLSNLLLAPDSPGKGAGNDNLDIGLTSGL